MLTFEFSGVEGKMTATETLTSGMVGKEISIITDSSWDGLQKFAVFRAGQVCKTVLMESSTISIPEEVLRRPFCKLFVGLYGTDAAETLVIPTIMAEGPYIRYGADPMEDSTAEELPVWKNLQDQIGDLEELDTLQKDSLVAAVNELYAKILAQPEEEEEEDTGLSSAAAALLIAILRQALYYTDQSANITALEALLGTSGGDSGETEPDTGGDTGGNEGEDSGDSGSSTDPTPGTYTVTYALTHVTTSNSDSTVSSGASYSATLTAEDGYELQTVTVIMGGTDISASACSGNTISIGSVTGNLIITAAAAEISTEESDLLYHWDFTTGSLVDLISGSTGITDDNVTLDSEGAHFTSGDSFLKMPVSNMAGSTVEVAFGEMSGGATRNGRLLMNATSETGSCTIGLFYSKNGYWTSATASTTEFTDVNMFANKKLIATYSSSGFIEWYCDDTFVWSGNLGYVPSCLCLGGWTSTALGDQSYYNMVVKSVKIYKTA